MNSNNSNNNNSSGGNYTAYNNNTGNNSGGYSNTDVEMGDLVPSVVTSTSTSYMASYNNTATGYDYDQDCRMTPDIGVGDNDNDNYTTTTTTTTSTATSTTTRGSHFKLPTEHEQKRGASKRLVDAATTQFVDIVNRLPITEPGGHFAASKNYTLRVFVDKMVNIASLDAETLVVAGMYMDRFLTAYPKCSANEGGRHRLAFATLMLAQKYTHDEPYSNTAWVKISHNTMNIREVNGAEVELLNLLKFNMYVSAETVTASIADLEAAATGSSSARLPSLALALGGDGGSSNNGNVRLTRSRSTTPTAAAGASNVFPPTLPMAPNNINNANTANSSGGRSVAAMASAGAGAGVGSAASVPGIAAPRPMAPVGAGGVAGSNSSMYYAPGRALSALPGALPHAGGSLGSASSSSLTWSTPSPIAYGGLTAASAAHATTATANQSTSAATAVPVVTVVPGYNVDSRDTEMGGSTPLTVPLAALTPTARSGSSLQDYYSCSNSASVTPVSSVVSSAATTPTAAGGAAAASRGRSTNTPPAIAAAAAAALASLAGTSFPQIPSIDLNVVAAPRSLSSCSTEAANEATAFPPVLPPSDSMRF